MIELKVSSHLKYDQKFDQIILNPAGPYNTIQRTAELALVPYQARALIVYKPIDFRKVITTMFRDQKALIVYNPINFRELAIQYVSREISGVKFELRRIEELIGSLLRTAEDYEKYGVTISQSLLTLKVRLITTVEGFEKEFADDVVYIQSGIVYFDAALEVMRKRSILEVFKKLGIGQPRNVMPHPLDQYLPRANANPWDELLNGSSGHQHYCSGLM